MTTAPSDVAASRTLWTLATTWADRRGPEPVIVSLPRPDSPEGMESLTWQELVELTWDLRRRLAAAGVREGARVVLCLPNSPLIVATWLAVQANGAVVHVVDPEAGRIALERAMTSTRPSWRSLARAPGSSSPTRRERQGRGVVCSWRTKSASRACARTSICP